METEEAIEKLNNGSEVFETDSILDMNILELIALLQQGEALKAENVELKAYKQIVEEINEMLRVDIANNTYDYNALDCAEGYLHQIKLIEQKYLKEERK